MSGAGPQGGTAAAPGWRGWLAAAWDGDVAWSFRHSPVAIVSAVVLAICLVGALFAPWLAPHNPFDLRTLNLLDALPPPAWLDGGQARSYLLGTDDQGRDVLSAIMFGARISLLVGLASVALADACSASRSGSSPATSAARVDAFIMRVADVQLSFPAILIALLIDGVARAALPRDAHDRRRAAACWSSRSALSNWVQYARTVRGSTMVEKNKEYVQAARVIGVSPLGDHAPPPAAQRAGAGAGAGDDQHRDGDHHRGDAVVPGRGRAADAAVAGHADPRRQRLPVLRRVVDHHLPGRRAGDHGAVDQPARRLAARRAQSEAALTRRSAPRPSRRDRTGRRQEIEDVRQYERCCCRWPLSALCPGCQTWGPTWSEVTGRRCEPVTIEPRADDHRADRRPRVVPRHAGRRSGSSRASAGSRCRGAAAAAGPAAADLVEFELDVAALQALFHHRQVRATRSSRGTSIVAWSTIAGSSCRSRGCTGGTPAK